MESDCFTTAFPGIMSSIIKCSIFKRNLKLSFFDAVNCMLRSTQKSDNSFISDVKWKTAKPHSFKVIFILSYCFSMLSYSMTCIMFCFLQTNKLFLGHTESGVSAALCNVVSCTIFLIFLTKAVQLFSFTSFHKICFFWGTYLQLLN